MLSRSVYPILSAVLLCLTFGVARPVSAAGAAASQDVCPRPVPGAVVPEPQDLRSVNGTLQVEMHLRNQRETDGSWRFCYVSGSGAQAPTLRLHPGDLLVLQLRNELNIAPDTSAHTHAHASTADACASGAMELSATNLHFHGLTIPALCHQDEVLKTSIEAGDPPFEYRFRIPADEPPGLYWYHPHIHGYSTPQVLGGASGALVIEGIEQANREVAGLPERVMVIRDQNLLNPDAPPNSSEPVVPKMLIDRDGDAANNGTGFGKPAKDLSINYVPVPYPDYPPALISIRPHERQLWRVLNASAVTYLNLAVLFNRRPQLLGIVALDGVPLNANGNAANQIEPRDHIGVPPGGRVEFIMEGPAPGEQGLFVTRTVDTGQGGENDPNRALALIVPAETAPEPRSILAASPAGVASPARGASPSGAAANARAWLGDVQPMRVRKLFFSERLRDAKNPNSATDFFLTVDGEEPRAFDPAATQPKIIVKHGDVEDWIIENRSSELHAFHIHQLHFILVGFNGMSVNEPFLRDTVNVPYYNGRALQYPSVRLRMDFRDPNAVGTLVYHCHLLEHEDGGMMGTVRVEK
jgi:FtsP/CotA-like multicopper oxidase with cupredoxin domain